LSTTNRMIIWLAVTLVVAFWFRFKPATFVDRVAKVVDGDTIALTSGKKIRLIGVDTPEVYESDKLFRDAKREGVSVAKIKARGRLASRFTKELADGQPVRLEFDIEQQDRYGRTLAYVFIPVCEWGRDDPPCQIDERPYLEYQERPGTTKDHAIYIFLNASILKAGYALPMNIRPNTRYADHFEALTQEAKQANRGLWGKN